MTLRDQTVLTMTLFATDRLNRSQWWQGNSHDASIQGWCNRVAHHSEFNWECL